MKALRQYGWPFTLFTAVGLLLFSYHYLDDLARLHYGTAAPRFVEEMTGAYTALVLFPFVLWFARRYPWPAQILGLAAYSVAHTTPMALSRAAIFPLAGLGRYDYGVMIWRYPMEASHDVIMYAIMVGFVYFIDRLRAADRLKAELAEARLENLRLQLHPHFLFNTLNAISAVMYEDVRKADAMLAKLSDFLRVILNSADAPEITIEEELRIEQMYVEIMKTRLESKLNLSWHVGGEATDVRVPALILQPLIENAIRHGMDSQRDALDIVVEVTRSGGDVALLVRDNGSGLREHASLASGRGLANVRSRLTQRYGARSEFTIGGAMPYGTQVRLSFPVAP